jgi:hypothetical protein
VLALDLAWQTVATADVPDALVHAWVAELLTNPTWGVLQYVKITANKAVIDIAELHRRAASGDMPPADEWEAAGRAAREIADPQRRRPVCGLGGVRVGHRRGWRPADDVGSSGRPRRERPRGGVHAPQSKPDSGAQPSHDPLVARSGRAGERRPLQLVG